MIGKMRIIKTPEEIEKIVKAQRIAERAFSRLLRDIKPGQTEKHVAALLEYYMAEYGSDGNRLIPLRHRALILLHLTPYLRIRSWKTEIF